MLYVTKITSNHSQLLSTFKKNLHY